MRPVYLTIALALASVSCAETPVNLHLEWDPTSDADSVKASALDAFSGKSFSVSIVDDERPHPMQVGQTSQETHGLIPVNTSDDVRQFVLDGVSKTLAQAGVSVQPTGSTHLLKITIAQLFVSEGKLYVGRTLLRMEVMDHADRSLWNANVDGAAKRWGKSRNRGAYRNALSDAIVDAVTNMLNNADLQTAIR